MAMRRPSAYAPLSAHYADDEKIMEAGEDAELLYVRMLAYAARTPRTEGWISDRVLQSRLGILPRPLPDGSGYESGTDAGSRAGKLEGVGLIARDGNGWRITSWLKWNRSAEEMERERVRDKNRKTSGNDGSRAGNGTGNRAGTDAGIPTADTDTDTDTERGGSRRKPARPIPTDWTPTKTHAKFAEENGVDLQAQAHKFRGDAVAKDKRFANWDQAFRNWLDKAVEFGQVTQMPQREKPSLALLPKCPTCNAPQEVTHYDECPDQKWRPTA